MALTSPRAGSSATRHAPETWGDEPQEESADVEHKRLIAQAVNGALEGKLNSVGTVTLTINVASTVLTDLRIGINSRIFFEPRTANAAAETMWISSKGKQTATITHTNNSQADRTFGYLVIG